MKVYNIYTLFYYGSNEGEIMKKVKIVAVLLAMVMMLSVCLVACNTVSEYTVTLDRTKSFLVEVGAQLDYTQFFIVKDRAGASVTVTEDMLDLSKVDVSHVGNTFTVTLTIGNVHKMATFIVVAKASDSDNPSQGGNNPSQGGDQQQGGGNNDQQQGGGGDNEQQGGGATDLSAVFAKYANPATWNFAVTVTSVDNGDEYTDYYEYDGNIVLNSYSSDGSDYEDYLYYDASHDAYYFYSDDGEGNYQIIGENSDDFEEAYSYLYLIYPNALASFEFTAVGNKYVANTPDACGNALLYEMSDYTWTSVELYIGNEQIVKVVATMNDGYTEQYVFSDYGKISLTLPDGTTGGGSDDSGSSTTPSGVMEKQTYDRNTFKQDTLQEKMVQYDKSQGYDGSIGLPSKGDYHALVIPVAFAGESFTQQELTDLNKAFNGTNADTGWESVSTYYSKSSYGNLNLTFDVQSVYQAKYNAKHYGDYGEYDSEGYYHTGEELVLTEALAYYEKRLDLTEYDTNDDGCIDAVYLIYSADVSYGDSDSLFWAFTTWYYGEEEYDGLWAYYYLFAGIDFIYESTSKDDFSGYDKISGLKINASTFIHETGHLLGLDDYYDYMSGDGCDEGLGGADMMDYTVGDHNAYSKIMLGWLTPTVVNDTATVTIESMQAMASNGVKAILIPLNFNNSYFCEYLLIDLYTADGLNELHSSGSDSYLYGGATFGVRIYHVSSSINSPYDNQYGSFTDYNNSDTDIALIKLIEADGETKFESTDGLAVKSDLWKAGDKLSNVFPNYTRNDGKKLCFDVEIVSVSSSSATITVTFAN